MIYATGCALQLRKENGELYPQEPCYIIASLQRYISKQKDAPVQLCNPFFKPLHRTLKNRYHELHGEGVETMHKKAEVFTSDEEE